MRTTVHRGTPSVLPLLLLSLLLCCVNTHRISKSCTSTCDFELCSPAKLSLLSAPSTPATPPICLEGRPVHVTSSGEAFVRSGASYYALISRAAPSADKSKPCAPNFFTTFPTASGAAAVGYQPSPGTDYSFLAGKCVSLPLNTVQLVSMTGVVLHEMHLEGRPLKDCVGFQVDEHVPPPPTTTTYSYEIATNSAATSTPAPMPRRAVDDVADGGRSALDARKRIMNSLDAPKQKPDGDATISATPVVAPVAPVAPAAPEDEGDEEPVASVTPLELAEPSASPDVLGEQEVSATAEEEIELFDAVPFSL